ncbi:P-loop containing nucleoside triphosphate hydrolase protein [Daedaleopsis nitida]|nr:P-loop containing nucleoside triphosphate hydrolase protein [Daedaleopsis nitida]
MADVPPPAYEISIDNLTYFHYSTASPSLSNVSIHLPKGSRTILVGANGAGKSTLLQILAGKRLIPDADVRIKGRDVFRNTPLGITFLGTEWAMNPVVRGDIVVSDFLNSVGGYRYKERRDRLLDILDVDLDWHMHQISDGERRRVQLCMGLMGDWDVLLLDEATRDEIAASQIQSRVTVDLDVLVRDDLLTFLKEDSETRGATILYATHIFDGLNQFPTHVAHMHLGTFLMEPTTWPFTGATTGVASVDLGLNPALYTVALQWLKEDRERRKLLEAGGRMHRGARTDEVPSDSEIFYRKYDYSH